MTPQGSVVYATKQIDAAIAQLELVQTQTQLQDLVDETFESFSAQLGAIQVQLDKLAPILALSKLSLSDLPSVLTFLGDLKTALLGPVIEPLLVYPAQLAAFAAQIARLSAAAQAAASRLEASVAIPAIPIPVVPS